MAHAATEEVKYMSLPIRNGKLAMWLFLGTEIMFFTGLLGAYIVLRIGAGENWPHHNILTEWMGALNTFILICSSITVVMAHAAIEQNKTDLCMRYLVATFIFGCIFMGIKMVEYGQKFEHNYLPHGFSNSVVGKWMGYKPPLPAQPMLGKMAEKQAIPAGPIAEANPVDRSHESTKSDSANAGVAKFGDATKHDHDKHDDKAAHGKDDHGKAGDHAAGGHHAHEHKGLDLCRQPTLCLLVSMPCTCWLAWSRGVRLSSSA